MVSGMSEAGDESSSSSGPELPFFSGLVQRVASRSADVDAEAVVPPSDDEGPVAGGGLFANTRRKIRERRQRKARQSSLSAAASLSSSASGDDASAGNHPTMASLKQKRTQKNVARACAVVTVACFALRLAQFQAFLILTVLINVGVAYVIINRKHFAGKLVKSSARHRVSDLKTVAKSWFSWVPGVGGGAGGGADGSGDSLNASSTGAGPPSGKKKEKKKAK